VRKPIETEFCKPEMMGDVEIDLKLSIVDWGGDDALLSGWLGKST
jgi:hypothetical protein